MLQFFPSFVCVFLFLFVFSSISFSQSNHAQIQSWIQSTALRIPPAPNDTSSLHAFFANKSVVCIGEATHGSSEIFTERNRLAQYLIENEGFICIGVEAPMTEIQAVNQYILGNSPDTTAQMKHFLYFASRTEEMKSLIEWLRRYNTTHTPKVQIYGIDITVPFSVAKTVRTFFLRHKPDAVYRVDSAYSWYVKLPTEQEQLRTLANLSQISPKTLLRYKERAETIYQYIQTLVGDTTYPRDELAWTLKNAEIMSVCLRNISLIHPSLTNKTSKYSLRDSCMAANALWILQQKREQPSNVNSSKMIIFAHNGHTQYGRDEDGDSTMGAYLKQSLKENILSISTGFYEGECNAVPEKASVRKSSKNGMLVHSVHKARKNSLEWYCHQSAITSALLFLSGGNQVLSVQHWLSRSHLLHHVGAAIDIPPSIEMQFLNLIPSRAFDAMLFIDKVSASHILD
jgi:erythromycin esterase